MAGTAHATGEAKVGVRANAIGANWGVRTNGSGRVVRGEHPVVRVRGPGRHTNREIRMRKPKQKVELRIAPP